MTALPGRSLKKIDCGKGRDNVEYSMFFEEGRLKSAKNFLHDQGGQKVSDFNRILVVSLSSGHSLKAVQCGISLAKNYGAKLFIIHIIYNPFGLKGWNLPVPSIKTLEEEFTNMSRKAKEDLDKYIEAEDTKGLSVEEKVVEGNPGDEILNFIEKERIDLLVMAAHEQGHIEHFISGQEIQDLVRKMPCSLLLVRRELEYKHFPP
jgi:nucleotide-binding universal stress UspA family protein